MDEREYSWNRGGVQSFAPPGQGATVIAVRPQTAAPAPAPLPVVERDPEAPLSMGSAIAFVVATPFFAFGLMAGLGTVAVNSLTTSLDGSSLRGDAVVGVVLGALLFAASLFLLSVSKTTRAGQRLGLVLGFSITLALVSAFFGVSAATSHATAVVHDGRSSMDGIEATPAAMLFLATFVVALVAVFRRWSARDAAMTTLTCVFLTAGISILLTSAYLFFAADRLAWQAAARPHEVTHATPLSPVVLAVAFVLVAVTLRRWRR